MATFVPRHPLGAWLSTVAFPSHPASATTSTSTTSTTAAAAAAAFRGMILLLDLTHLFDQSVVDVPVGLRVCDVIGQEGVCVCGGVSRWPRYVIDVVTS